MDLERRKPVCCALLDSRQSKSDIRTVSKSIVLLSIGQRDSEELIDLHWPSIGMNQPPQVDVAVIIPESRNPFKTSPDRSGDPTYAFGVQKEESGRSVGNPSPTGLRNGCPLLDSREILSTTAAKVSCKEQIASRAVGGAHRPCSPGYQNHTRVLGNRYTRWL